MADAKARLTDKDGQWIEMKFPIMLEREDRVYFIKFKEKYNERGEKTVSIYMNMKEPNK